MTEDGGVAKNEKEFNPQRYRLVLADDHDDILEAVRHLLAPDFEVVGSVRDGAALIQAVLELRPDAVITDIYMPGLNGIECGVQILHTGLSPAVIVLSMHKEPHLVEKALQQGIRGYVLKEDAGAELVPAVYTVLRGGTYLSHGVSGNGRS